MQADAIRAAVDEALVVSSEAVRAISFTIDLAPAEIAMAVDCNIASSTARRPVAVMAAHPPCHIDTPKSTIAVPPSKIPNTIVSSFIKRSPFWVANDRAFAQFASVNPASLSTT
jgi:hypothetical protein